jgi:hypothetical protein
MISAFRRTCETKYTGHYCLPSSRIKAILTSWSVIAKQRIKISLMVGRVRHGGFNKYCLIFSKAFTHSIVHLKRADLHIILKKGRHTSLDLAINRLRVANFSASD